MKRIRLRTTAVLGLLLSAALTAEAATAKPNIVYIIIDELGYYESSHMGHPELRTPNIDRLAAEGVRFTQCLAGSAVCAPTRCALLTGKHAGHMTVRGNSGSDPLRADEATIGTLLQQAGYATGGFGKWGVGSRGTSGVPEKHGFDEFFGYYNQVHAHTHYPRYLVRNSEEVPLAGNTGDPRNGKTFSQYRIVAEAKKFIRANKDRPFLAYLCWTPPHGLWGFPKDDPAWALYQHKPWPEDAKMYAAMVSMVDRQVGEIRDLLQELGLAENTFILFTGDNGGQDYFADASHPRGWFRPNVNPKTGVEFRGGKSELYEGGLRVPAIACWPGKIAAGRVSEQLCYFPDLMPTFAELAGAACPTNTDGLSLVPELLGEKMAGHKQAQHRYLYWEIGNQTAVRMGDWKAFHQGTNVWELYNLASDLSEKTNVAAQHRDVLQQMKTFAAEAHQPVRKGEVYDEVLMRKDQRYFTQPASPAAK